MLVVVRAPPNADAEFFAKLSRDTGLVAYDLRTRLRAGVWGVLRAVAVESEATATAAQLRSEGFDAVAISAIVARDTERRIVDVRAVELGEAGLELQLRRRRIPVPYAGLLLLARGAIRLGDWTLAHSAGGVSSSNGLRAVGGVRVIREPTGQELDAYAALDLHFATVLWIARVDVRHADLSKYGKPGTPEALDALADLIAARSGVRVDRAHRVSSLVSHLDRPPTHTSTMPPPSRPTDGAPATGPNRIEHGSSVSRLRAEPTDSRFDGYSRLVAEAERLLLEARQ